MSTLFGFGEEADVIKLGVVGESSIGKTSLCVQYTTRQFDTRHLSTPQQQAYFCRANNFTHESLKGRDILVEVVDNPGWDSNDVVTQKVGEILFEIDEKANREKNKPKEKKPEFRPLEIEFAVKCIKEEQRQGKLKELAKAKGMTMEEFENWMNTGGNQEQDPEEVQSQEQSMLSWDYWFGDQQGDPKQGPEAGYTQDQLDSIDVRIDDGSNGPKQRMLRKLAEDMLKAEKVAMGEEEEEENWDHLPSEDTVNPKVKEENMTTGYSGFMVVYDFGSKRSYNRAQKIIEGINMKMNYTEEEDKQWKSKVGILLVGNKKDLRGGEREVGREPEGFAEKYEHCEHFKTSSKMNDGVQEAFEKLIVLSEKVKSEYEFHGPTEDESCVIQ